MTRITLSSGCEAPHRRRFKAETTFYRSFLRPVLVLVMAGLTSFVYAGPDEKNIPIQRAPPPEDWYTDAISPVTNPIYFEDARIETDVQLLYLYNHVSRDFGIDSAIGHLTLGEAEIQAAGAQIRWAVTPRFAFIATNDVYIHFSPKVAFTPFGVRTPYVEADGYSDFDVGFKYAVIDDRAHQFILTPIVTYAIPTGGVHVFQGDNGGIFNLAVSSEKGFGKLHVMVNAGFLVPVEQDRNSSEVHYSLHIDYFLHHLFIPFFEFNGFTVLSSPSGTKGPLGTSLGDKFGIPTLVKTGLNTEGADLINFGASGLTGHTQADASVGFRSRLLKNLDIGFAYSHEVTTSPAGIELYRFTGDVLIHF